MIRALSALVNNPRFQFIIFWGGTWISVVCGLALVAPAIVDIIGVR